MVLPGQKFRSRFLKLLPLFPQALLQKEPFLAKASLQLILPGLYQLADLRIIASHPVFRDFPGDLLQGLRFQAKLLVGLFPEVRLLGELCLRLLQKPFILLDLPLRAASLLAAAIQFQKSAVIAFLKAFLLREKLFSGPHLPDILIQKLLMGGKAVRLLPPLAELFFQKGELVKGHLAKLGLHLFQVFFDLLPEAFILLFPFSDLPLRLRLALLLFLLLPPLLRQAFLLLRKPCGKLHLLFFELRGVALVEGFLLLP